MNDPFPTRRTRWMGITIRTALLAWLVAIATLIAFVLALLPQLKRTLLESLQSKAYGITVSLREVTAGAAVNEDYSSVVDHCTEVLKGDPALDFIVITRKDGFSLVHDRAGWTSKILDASWHPAERVPAGGIRTVPLFGRRAYAYSQPFDYSGIEWGWVHVGLTLDSYDRSIATLYRQTALLGVACIMLSLLASMIYAKRLVHPVLVVQGVVQRVASGDLSARAPIERKDELGSLASSVNVMAEALLHRDRTLQEAKETLELRVDERTKELQEQVTAKERALAELATAQDRLLAASHETGMAEVATGVLHNVGNVLNSVNVSANLLRERIGGARAQTLLRAVLVLRSHEADLACFLAEDPQGRQALAFLEQIARHLADECSACRGEIETICRHVDHIKEIVAMQQSYARPGGLIERVSAAELLDDALRLKESSCQRHRIAVQRDYAPLPSFAVDKHRVIQILINLVANAVHALKTSAAIDRRIVARIAAVGEDRMKFVVEDNGVGIAPENLTRIFSHGFTTRRDGHGFGLHSGALAARSLGGSLVVASPGPGQGASFTLELPITPSNMPPS